MNYYDKLLLESNIELYNNRYSMAISILESFGIELSEDDILESYDSALESIEMELNTLLERKKTLDIVDSGTDDNVGSRADQADHLEKTFDRLKKEVRDVKRTKRAARAKRIINAVITIAASSGAVAGLSDGSKEGQLLAMVTIPLAVISNISTALNRDVRDARHTKRDAIEWMELKLDELDENIRTNKGNIAVQKNLRNKIANEKSKIENGIVGNALINVASSAKTGISNAFASSTGWEMTPALASESVEVDVIETYGLEFLTESENTSQIMNQAEIDKTKKTIGTLKAKKDSNGLMKICRKLGNIAKKHPKATALFVFAATATIAVSAGAFDDEIASIANAIATAKQTAIDGVATATQAAGDGVATAKQVADDLHTLATLARTLEESQEAIGGSSPNVLTLLKLFG